MSAAATVAHRISMAKLLLQKATVELDRGDAKAAIATAEEAIRQYETEIVPHTRSDRVLDDFAQQLTLVGRIAAVGRDGDARARPIARCRRRSTALAPNLTERPRVRLTVLDSEFLCVEARYFGGEHDESERAMAALAKRVDDAVPVQGGLMSDWRSLRARVARLRAGMRVIAGDAKGAVPLMREAIRYHQDACRSRRRAPTISPVWPLCRGNSPTSSTRRRQGRRAQGQAEAAFATWRKADGHRPHRLQAGDQVADAMVNPGDLWQKDEPRRPSGSIQRRRNMAMLQDRVPRRAAQCCEPRRRALLGGDALTISIASTT